MAPSRDRSSSPIVTMKFGGAAVADAGCMIEVARRLVAEHTSGSRVIGVLSAMGTTTDDLLALARSVSPAPNPRELDMLITTGERIACALCAMAVIDLGHAAVSLTGSQAGIVTTSGHGDARIVDVRTHRIEHELHRGALVLVAGFQGVSTDREVTSLGRGGADTTAVALASALGATRCDVFTGVAPPATSNGAISHDALARLVAAGAFPMSLRSLEIARDHGVRLQLCSSSGDEPDVWVVTED